MHFTTIALMALLSLTSAQMVHVVSVGSKSNESNALTFSPSKLKAKAGDVVQFQFRAGNHTVTQSSFDQPCVPISQVSPNVTGVHSGYQPVAASEAMGMVPTYSIMINDTKPLWLYCAQGKHCQNGMTMVINENTAANGTRSLENFQQLASTATGGSGASADTSAGTGTGTGADAGGNSTTGTGSDSGSGSGSATTGEGASGTGAAAGAAATAGSSLLSVPSALGLFGLVATVFAL